MIKTEYLELQSFLREKIKTSEDYKKATSIAVGVSVSKLLPLPTATMEDIALHFDTVVRYLANELIIEFNENIIIDIDLALETARSFWLIRYSAAYPDAGMHSIPMGNYSFLEKLHNVCLYGNPATFAYVNQYSELMTVLVNRMMIVLKKA